MTDEELKRLIKEEQAETRRHIGVLMERQEVRFDAVNEAIDRVEGRLGGVEGRLDGVEGRLEGLEGRLDGVEGRLEGLEGRLEGVEGRLGRVEETIARESSATRTMIRLLQERVEHLEEPTN